MNRISREMDFMGYRREDGNAGTRNYVGIFSAVLCANEVAENISREVNGTAYFVHNSGCCQTPPDIRRAAFAPQPSPCAGNEYYA